MSGIGIKLLRDYERQKAGGEPLRFEPEKLGIKNTECWGGE
jgi:hypothetical protein